RGRLLTGGRAMAGRRHTAGGAALLALAGLAAAGCSPVPRAPALDNGPVYENAKEGVRFVVPDGWVQFARADTPPGRVTQALLLVGYHITNANRLAELELYRADLAEGADLAAFLAANRIGTRDWEPKAAPQRLQVNGAEATRLLFTRRDRKAEFVREVVAFRRGGRLYLFALSAEAGDEVSRDQWRQTLNSVRRAG